MSFSRSGKFYVQEFLLNKIIEEVKAFKALLQIKVIYINIEKLKQL